MKKTSEDSLFLTDQLSELRSRLIRCFMAIVIAFFICYFFKEKLFFILIAPLKQAMEASSNSNISLIFTGLPEAFFSYLKVAFLSAFLLALPYIFIEFWLFVSPGLYKKEKKVLIPIILLSIVFFAGGALFAYFIVFPWGFSFFLSFATNEIQALPSMKEYLSFASKMLIVFGMVFEMPLVLTALAAMGIVNPKHLTKYRKYAILIFFIVAAILTPPDIITQIMLTIPLIFLYEISILSTKLVYKKKDKDGE